jgi:hypothetical protein
VADQALRGLLHAETNDELPAPMSTSSDVELLMECGVENLPA